MFAVSLTQPLSCHERQSVSRLPLMSIQIRIQRHKEVSHREEKLVRKERCGQAIISNISRSVDKAWFCAGEKMVEVIVATAADVAGKGLEEGVCTPNRPCLAATSLVPPLPLLQLWTTQTPSASLPDPPATDLMPTLCNPQTWWVRGTRVSRRLSSLSV